MTRYPQGRRPQSQEAATATCCSHGARSWDVQRAGRQADPAQEGRLPCAGQRGTIRAQPGQRVHRDGDPYVGSHPPHKNQRSGPVTFASTCRARPGLMEADPERGRHDQGVDSEIVIGRPVEVVFDYVAGQSNEPPYNPHMVRTEKITTGRRGKPGPVPAAPDRRGRLPMPRGPTHLPRTGLAAGAWK